MSGGGRFAEVVAQLEGGVGTVYPAAQLYCGRDGLATLSLAVGDADGATAFDLASLTKALSTTLLCMQRYERGQLPLDEAVLPGVALGQLLAHTSGLPAWRPLFLEAQPGTDLATAPSEQGRQALTAAAAATARGAAGAQACYSDLGFILLGDWLERRCGQRLDQLFAPIASRLGIDVGFRPLDRPASAATGHYAATRRETAAREPLSGVVHDDNARAMLGVAGHAGLFGTATAVAAIGEALLDCYHDLRSPRQQALGLSAATVRRFFARPAGPPGATFGLGWDHPSPTLSSAGQRWPSDGVGHLGFTGCSLWLDPAARLCVVLLSNRVNVATAEEAARRQVAIRSLRPSLHDAIRDAYAL